MAKIGSGKISFFQFSILNLFLHLIAIFLSYHYYFDSNASLTSTKIVIYQILGTLFWLILIQLSKFNKLQKISKKFATSSFNIWSKLSIGIRIIISLIFVVGMIWNDYLRIAACSYLSAISISQYTNEQQQNVIHYSTQSIITTGYPSQFPQENRNETLPQFMTNVAVTPTSSFSSSSSISTLRHRLGRSDSTQSVLPTYVPRRTPTAAVTPTPTKKQSEIRPSLPLVHYPKPVDEVWGGVVKHSATINQSFGEESSNTPTLPSTSTTSSKRKHNEVDSENGLTSNGGDEVPAKKREVESNRNGVISNLISHLPDWKSFFPRLNSREVLLPTTIPPSSITSSNSQSGKDGLESDSKKRPREDNEQNAEINLRTQGTEIARVTKNNVDKSRSNGNGNANSNGNDNDEDDDEDQVIGIRKMSRKNENFASKKQIQLPSSTHPPPPAHPPTPAPSSTPHNIPEHVPKYLSKPHISLVPPQPTKDSDRLLLETSKESGQLSYQRPVLKSRHAVSIEEYSNKRRMSFEIDDQLPSSTGEKEGSSEHDRLVATISTNRQQMLQATEKLLKGAVTNREEVTQLLPSKDSKIPESKPVLSFTSSTPQTSEKPLSFSFQSGKQSDHSIPSVSIPSNQSLSSQPFSFMTSSIPTKAENTTLPTLTTNLNSSHEEKTSQNNEPTPSSETPLSPPPHPPSSASSPSNFQLEKSSSIAMKKPPPSPTVRKSSFDEKRNGIAFLPANLSSLPSPAENPSTVSGIKTDDHSSNTNVTQSSTNSSLQGFSFSSNSANSSNFQTSKTSENSSTPTVGFAFGSKENSSTNSTFGSLASSGASTSTNSAPSSGFSFGGFSTGNSTKSNTSAETSAPSTTAFSLASSTNHSNSSNITSTTAFSPFGSTNPSNTPSAGSFGSFEKQTSTALNKSTSSQSSPFGTFNSSSSGGFSGGVSGQQPPLAPTLEKTSSFAFGSQNTANSNSNSSAFGSIPSNPTPTFGGFGSKSLSSGSSMTSSSFSGSNSTFNGSTSLATSSSPPPTTKFNPTFGQSTPAAAPAPISTGSQPFSSPFGGGFSSSSSFSSTPSANTNNPSTSLGALGSSSSTFGGSGSTFGSSNIPSGPFGGKFPHSNGFNPSSSSSSSSTPSFGVSSSSFGGSGSLVMGGIGGAGMGMGGGGGGGSGGFSLGSDQKSDRKKVKPKLHFKK